MNSSCRKCAHYYCAKCGAESCLRGRDLQSDDCPLFEKIKHCCFDCREFDVAQKNCRLGHGVPGAFKRHACADFERMKVK